MAKATLKLGTISHGTLRPKDVVPELLWTLEHWTDKRGAVKARKLRREFDRLPENDPDGGADEIWNEACEALEAYTPPFCYVGAIEGDGSDIGVWTSDDAIENGIAEGEIWQEQDCNCGLDYPVRDAGQRWSAARQWWPLDPRAKGHHLGTCASRMPKDARYRLVISDHGNMSLYTRKGRPVW